MLAAKAAIATRVDALGEETNTDLGIEHRAKVESRIRQLEGGQISQISGSAKKSAKFDKFEAKGEVVEYKAAADVTGSGSKRKGSTDSDDEEEDGKPAVKKIKVEEVEVKSEKKKKKKKDKAGDVTAEEVMDTSEVKAEETVEKKKKKKKDKEAPEEANSTLETTADASLLEEGGEKKKKKKKKKEAE